MANEKRQKMTNFFRKNEKKPDLDDFELSKLIEDYNKKMAQMDREFEESNRKMRRNILEHLTEEELILINNLYGERLKTINKRKENRIKSEDLRTL